MDHRPVLLAEVMGFLAGGSARVLLDATVGLGGHAAAFLTGNADGSVIGMDRDLEILELARERLSGFGSRVSLHHSAFSRLGEVLDAEGVPAVDAALFDFGVSSVQLDQGERGFSFRHDAPLDMRMDRSCGETAAELVNRLREPDLGNLIFELGGERSARRVAAAIVAERRRERIETTGRLATIVRRAVRGRGRIDAATRTFQALRMAVNDELGEIEKGLDAAASRLTVDGLLLAIAFHSGEDRIVKHTLRADPRLEVLTKKVVRPTPQELRGNPRARSSRLRVARRRNEDA
ncbi:MAG: 16S rRNA (cytosine(1402)-N(4))-methyltransferase RsmH [Planctomycetota bacterium]